MRNLSMTTVVWLALLLIALLALASYWPGLSGGFLFDDFANLPTLGSTGPIDNWAAFCRYVTSGTADPTGRPLTLLSFLLDARNWPADPLSFKRTNLILHLINGTLLFALLNRLGHSLDLDERRRKVSALMGSALWLLHPLFVSTTLYIVQREAMLPATCVLLGLLLWLHGREHLRNNHVKPGVLYSLIGLGGFTVLGTLAKANGILLPFYALLIEYMLLARLRPMPNASARKTQSVLMTALCIIPATLIFSCLCWYTAHEILRGGNAGIRPWSVGQRLLTEPRVLLEYLKLLWFPRPFSSGLFNDQFVISANWLHPADTLVAAIATLALIGTAWLIRRTHPAAALALLFYFTGQLIESTSIPLELYFEHRNYVPALLMFWPLGIWLADFQRLGVLKRVLIVGLPLSLALMTYVNAQVWGDQRGQAQMWARLNPNSPRAQANAADTEMQLGHPVAAIRILEPLIAKQPDQVQLAFNMIGARCMTGYLGEKDIAAGRYAMQNSLDSGALIAHWFQRMLPTTLSNKCPGLTSQNLVELIDAGLKNSHLTAAGPRQDLTYLRGTVALETRQPDLALADFEAALDLQIRPGIALQGAAQLGSHGYPKQGLALLAHYEQIKPLAPPPEFGMPMLHEWVLARQQYWAHELDHLKRQLMLDSTTSDRATPH